MSGQLLDSATVLSIQWTSGWVGLCVWPGGEEMHPYTYIAFRSLLSGLTLHQVFVKNFGGFPQSFHRSIFIQATTGLFPLLSLTASYHSTFYRQAYPIQFS